MPHIAWLIIIAVSVIWVYHPIMPSNATVANPNAQPNDVKNPISFFDDIMLSAPLIEEIRPFAVPMCTTYAGDFSTCITEYISNTLAA